MQGAALCAGTAQTPGRSGERKGISLGKAAARLGEEQEHPRYNCKQGFFSKQAASRGKFYLQGLQPPHRDNSTSPMVF